MSFRFNYQLSEATPKTLAVRLTKGSERKLLSSGHPWIFSDSIRRISENGKTGDIAILFRNHNNEVFGVGLYDAGSPIRIKMLHYYSGQMIDSDFFNKKISEAYARRKELLDQPVTGYRLLFGENDGFPGLVADVYAQVLVIKLYSGIWFPYLKQITEILLTTSGCTVAVLRLSRLLQSEECGGLKDGQVLVGELADEDVEFEEYGVRFLSNVIKGHKTGFFLDQRQNRSMVGSLAKGKTVLDVFTYSGGFAVQALANGAREVTGIDVSQQALGLSKRNADLNSFSGDYRTICGDAFQILSGLVGEEKHYDLVIIDPPSFAKKDREVSLALKKYRQLASLGAQLVARKGILVLASCSSRVSAEDFFKEVEISLRTSGRKFTLVKKTLHDVDHPVTFKEGAYLKCGFYQF